MIPQSVDPFLAAQQARRRRMVIIRTVVIVAPLLYLLRLFVLVGSRGYENFENRLFHPDLYQHALSPTEQAKVASLMATARAREEEEAKNWRKAIDAALAGKLGPRDDLGACPTHVPAPAQQKDLPASEPDWLTVVRRGGDPAAAKSGRYSHFEFREGLFKSQLGEPHTDHRIAELLQEAQAFADASPMPWDVLFLVDREAEPSGLGSEAGFRSGEIDGRAYLYDYRRGAVTCAALVHVENSDEVRYRYTSRLGLPDPGAGILELAEALKEDLRGSMYRTVASSLMYRAGPPL